MSRTVTATASGSGSANGLALTVKVLTGAALTQAGATATSTVVTTPELPLTAPVSTGSWVYGSVSSGVGSTAFTAAATTTFSENFSDTTNSSGYGTFRSTSTTTAGTAVTVGGTAPTGSSGLLAISLAEIQKATGQTLSEDASSPASLGTATAKTLTTAAFTPPAGSLLVAMVSADFTGSGTVALGVSDTGGLTWTKLAGDPTTITAVYVAQVPTTTASAAGLLMALGM